MSFEAKDLQIVDPLEEIRANPEKYLRRDSLINHAVIGRVTHDIAHVLKYTAFMSSFGDWTVIGADQIWLVEDSQTSLIDYFTRFVPMKFAGPNCFHSAILLGALAIDIAVFTKAGGQGIKGEFPSDLNPMQILPHTCVQCVIFRCDISATKQ